MRHTSIYEIWKGIIQRCTNPKKQSFHNYGERGIEICKEWRYDFPSFLDYVSRLEHYGEKGRSLDRVDNNLGYFPGNMRWATDTEQARNKRNSLIISLNGKTQCLAAWAEEVGINRVALWKRINRGWDAERAFTTPLDLRFSRK